MKLSFKELKKDNFMMVGIIIFLLLIFIGIFAPIMSSYSPVESSNQVFLKPSTSHWLGTNDIGQDIFSRLVHGLRTSIVTSIAVGILATFIATFVGTIAPLISGYFDRFVLRLCDIFLVLPEFIICLLIASYIQPNIVNLIIIISLLNWQGPLKVIRSQVIICKNDLSVCAARTFGASNIYILRKYLIPQIFPIVVSTFIRNARIAVFMEASIAYLGMVDPEMISLGKIMSNSMLFTYLDVWKWWLLPTGGV